MPKFKTMDDFDFKDKTVLVRVDINSPLDKETKEIIDDTRIRRHAETIGELSEREAKTVVLAHQGRPGGDDFTSLLLHSKRISEILNKPVNFTEDIFGGEAQSLIQSLKPGDILILNNVRMWTHEQAKKTPQEFAQTEFIQSLAPLSDIFVNDAFAAAHRGHASMVGFTEVLSSAAGRLMERELNALNKVKEAEKKPCLYVLGGAKAEDTANITEYVLSTGKADYVLTGGVVANLCLHAVGVDIGTPNLKLLEKDNFTDLSPKIKELSEKYGEKLVIPSDVAVSLEGERAEVSVSELPTNDPIFDIGNKTSEFYADLIANARIIFLNGPMGVFEKEEFSAGTKKVFEAIAESDAYKVAGGGHTLGAIEKLGLREKFSYISTGGGVLMRFLMGKTLPAVAALEKAANLH